jgi:hypothetical protein
LAGKGFIRRFLALDFRTQHPHFENDSFGLQPLAQLVHSLRREARACSAEMSNPPLELALASSINTIWERSR